jgi:hypothetical protein
MQLGSTPVLFDEIEFTVVFWIKITEVPMRLNKFLEIWLLVRKIWLCEEDAAATAVHSTRRAFKVTALCKKTTLWP